MWPLQSMVSEWSQDSLLDWGLKTIVLCDPEYTQLPKNKCMLCLNAGIVLLGEGGFAL